MFQKYVYIHDFCEFILKIIKLKKQTQLPPVINFGSGKVLSIKNLAALLIKFIPNFNSDLWQWNKLEYRTGETKSFYNCSKLSLKYGFKLSDINNGLKETAQYYFKDLE